MMTTTLIAIAVLAVALAVLVLRQSDEFRVARSALMAAPPAALFAQVNDFRNWESWSPWAKLDPAAKNTFEGPSAGVGASFAWSGNNQVGAGRMTIVESRPDELIRIRIEFLKPFKATNTVEFVFEPDAGGTRVTWSMFGRNALMGKAMSLFMDCDKMLGGYFDQGLSRMKAIVENR